MISVVLDPWAGASGDKEIVLQSVCIGANVVSKFKGLEGLLFSSDGSLLVRYLDGGRGLSDIRIEKLIGEEWTLLS